MIRPIPILVRHAVPSFANATFPPFPTIRRPRPRHLASFSPHSHSAAIVLGPGFPLFIFLSSHQSHKGDSPRSLLTSLSVIVFACSISTSHYITGIWASRNPSFNHQLTFTSDHNTLYIQQLIIHVLIGAGSLTRTLIQATTIFINKHRQKVSLHHVGLFFYCALRSAPLSVLFDRVNPTGWCCTDPSDRTCTCTRTRWSSNKLLGFEYPATGCGCLW